MNLFITHYFVGLEEKEQRCNSNPANMADLEPPPSFYWFNSAFRNALWHSAQNNRERQTKARAFVYIKMLVEILSQNHNKNCNVESMKLG